MGMFRGFEVRQSLRDQRIDPSHDKENHQPSSRESGGGEAE